MIVYLCIWRCSWDDVYNMLDSWHHMITKLYWSRAVHHVAGIFKFRTVYVVRYFEGLCTSMTMIVYL